MSSVNWPRGGVYRGAPHRVGDKTPEFLMPAGVLSSMKRDVTAAIATATAKIVVGQLVDSGLLSWGQGRERLLELHRRFDVGHEMVLPERGRTCNVHIRPGDSLHDALRGRGRFWWLR